MAVFMFPSPSLIIALGMLVDDAIVIIDSIQVLIDQGVDKMTACVRGTKWAVLPVFTAILTTAAAFAPYFYGKVARKFRQKYGIRYKSREGL